MWTRIWASIKKWYADGNVPPTSTDQQDMYPADISPKVKPISTAPVPSLKPPPKVKVIHKVKALLRKKKT